MRQLYKESQEIVRKVQQLKIEADLPTEDIDETAISTDKTWRASSENKTING